MKAHGKHVLLMPILLDEHGLAQTNQPMYASPTQKASVRGKGLRVDNQPLFILDQETTKNPPLENQAFENELGAVILAED